MKAVVDSKQMNLCSDKTHYEAAVEWIGPWAVVCWPPAIGKQPVRKNLKKKNPIYNSNKEI